MALLKRVSSLRKSRNYSVSPRKPEPDNAERPKGMIRCHTTLLDDTTFICDLDVSVASSPIRQLAAKLPSSLFM